MCNMKLLVADAMGAANPCSSVTLIGVFNLLYFSASNRCVSYTA